MLHVSVLSEEVATKVSIHKKSVLCAFRMESMSDSGCSESNDVQKYIRAIHNGEVKWH